MKPENSRDTLMGIYMPWIAHWNLNDSLCFPKILVEILDLKFKQDGRWLLLPKRKATSYLKGYIETGFTEQIIQLLLLLWMAFKSPYLNISLYFKSGNNSSNKISTCKYLSEKFRKSSNRQTNARKNGAIWLGKLQYSCDAWSDWHIILNSERVLSVFWRFI